MKLEIILASFSLGLGLVPARPAAAHEEMTVGYQLESAVATTYVSRGVAQYAARTDPSYQNTLSARIENLGPGALTVGVWNATALHAFGDQPGTALQVDLSATYKLAISEEVTVSAGYVYSLCPLQPSPDLSINPAQEVMLQLSYATWLFTPSVALFAEVAHQQGAYAAFGLGRDWAFGPLTVTPALNVGFAAYFHYQGGDLPAPPHLNDVTGSVDLKLSLPSDVYLLARGSYALRGTPEELLPEGEERAIAYASLAIGVAR